MVIVSLLGFELTILLETTEGALLPIGMTLVSTRSVLGLARFPNGRSWEWLS